ncbi:MAG: GNAT family N-acetyltransferase [Lachnospiraceae bacterium]|nr:GNAT family N-acetyltransferase [Lachnospiraceae bacterium]
MIIKELDIKEHRKLITDFFFNVFTKEPWNDDWSDTDQLNAYIEDLAGKTNSLTYGFFENDTISEETMLGLTMGSVKHWYRGTEYLIDELCVRTDKQGMGIGTAFMDEIKNTLTKKDIHKIFLLTDKDAPAFEFYKKQGFVLEDMVALHSTF